MRTKSVANKDNNPRFKSLVCITVRPSRAASVVKSTMFAIESKWYLAQGDYSFFFEMTFMFVLRDLYTHVLAQIKGVATRFSKGAPDRLRYACSFSWSPLTDFHLLVIVLYV